MKMYLYTNYDSLLDAISRCAFICRAADDKCDRITIGNVYEYAVFVTHKKLNCDEWGRCEHAVAVEFDFYRSSEISFFTTLHQLKVILVKNDYSLCLGTFDEYNDNIHIGLFVSGFVPMSYLSRIYILGDRYKYNYQSSPDLWDPSSQWVNISTSDSEKKDFSDILKYERLFELVKNDPLLKPIPAVINQVLKYQKALAAGIATVMNNYRHNHGYFSTTLDLVSAKYSSFNDIFITLASKYKEMNIEILDPLNQNDDFLDKQVFLSIKRFFENLNIDRSTGFDEDLFQSLYSYIEKNNFEGQLYLSNQMELLRTAIFDYDVDQKHCIRVLVKYPVMHSLYIVWKNPHNLDVFSQTLNIKMYKISPIVKRMAWILFATINGMAVMPGSIKNNFLLIRCIENNAMNSLNPDIVKPIYHCTEGITCSKNKYGKLLYDEYHEIKLNMNLSCIFEIICTNVDKISCDDYVQNLSQNDIDNPIVNVYRKYSVTKPVSVEQGLDLDYQNYLRIMDEICGAFSKYYDNTMFVRDVIDFDKFSKIYRLNKAYFDSMYVSILTRGDYE